MTPDTTTTTTATAATTAPSADADADADADLDPDPDPDADRETDGGDGTVTTGAAAAPTEDRSVRLTRRETERWYGLAGVALVFGGAGVLTTRPSLLLASAVCAGVLGLVAVVPTPPAELAVSRTFDHTPAPGETVAVTVTVRNAGDSLLPDLRLVDAVPESLAVVAGSPRRAVTLPAGATATLSYTVVAQRGRHEFGDTTGIVRGPTGTTEDEYRIETSDVMTVEPGFEPLEDVPLRSLTTRSVGRLPAEAGGAGSEFYATREYRPGDPMNRIDWNRHARSGELATLEFRPERAASVVLVADAREPSFVAPDTFSPSAVEAGIGAITRLFPTLLDHGHTVGVATLGESVRWLPPDTGPDHRARARVALGSDAAFSPGEPPEPVPSVLSVRDLRKRLSETDQLIVCSPLCDDGILRTIRLLDARGNQATVLSPDPTGSATRGQRVATMERHRRVRALQQDGIRVIDWPLAEPIETVLARVTQRWSR